MSAYRINSLLDSTLAGAPSLDSAANRPYRPAPRSVRRLPSWTANEYDQMFLQPVLATFDAPEEMVLFLQPKMGARD